MDNIKINGDNNQIFSQINNSRINSNNEVKGDTSKTKLVKWIAILVAVLTLIVTCIIGWDAIVKFFNL